ncbi:hypothetical protein [Ornithinibacillus bavariensis]|uniref:hypothetical protein n=1 Tax=Ornithinibacillus bavariensis TaxID=545502 RepID=UPI000EBFAB35|nr:hypothetical protein [Ornithinibacillus sp.]
MEKQWNRTNTSAAAAIYGAITYGENSNFSLVDVMGLTGHAFRINIDCKEVNVAGPTMFPGGYILRRNLCNLGFISCLADAEAPVSPENVTRTIALIQDSIDRGYPAIAFDLFVPEFGLIYGYDDEKQVFHGKDAVNNGTIPYEKFSNVHSGVLFATTISEQLPHSKYERLRMALDMIVDHTLGREWNHIFKDQYKMGLEGYDAWMNVLKQRKADPYGQAYNIHVISDAREFAVQFLKELEQTWTADNIVERTVRKLAGEAAQCYQKTAAALIEMRDLFPFPEGGNPQNPAHSDKAIALLTTAKQGEEDGIKLLERLLHFMKAYHSEVWIH